MPRWVGPLYLVLAGLLLVWTAYLAVALPPRHVAEHYDLAWTGFDAAMAVALGGTAVGAYRGSPWVAPWAAAAGTMLLVDAWFDCATARWGWEFTRALVDALVIEVPLAVLSFYTARHVEAVLVSLRGRPGRSLLRGAAGQHQRQTHEQHPLR